MATVASARIDAVTRPKPTAWRKSVTD
jgi:hypothetical protein